MGKRSYSARSAELAPMARWQWVASYASAGWNRHEGSKITRDDVDVALPDVRPRARANQNVSNPGEIEFAIPFTDRFLCEHAQEFRDESVRVAPREPLSRSKATLSSPF